ncbi:MAG TPA: EamA family transporter [Rhabdaerophilum sp.]|nr:EamA family transporter [Rhabdaerophilum sp.]
MIAAGAMHAGWNALIKIRLEPLLAVTLINATAAVVALPALIGFGWPGPESYPWLAASALLHTGYNLLLASAYRIADMSLVYPVARGTAPLLTALFSVVILKEPVDWLGALGIAVLGLGIFAMSIRSAAETANMDRKALLLAGATAIMICGYTIADGTGARASGNTVGYVAAMFLLDGLGISLIALKLRGLGGLRAMLGFAGPGIAGGTMACLAYAIAIWAMTVAPIPLVAAVRETSVLFAAVIAIVFLKEPLRANRLLGAALIVAGLAMIRLQ